MAALRSIVPWTSTRPLETWSPTTLDKLNKSEEFPDKARRMATLLIEEADAAESRCDCDRNQHVRTRRYQCHRGAGENSSRRWQGRGAGLVGPVLHLRAAPGVAPFAVPFVAGRSAEHRVRAEDSVTTRRSAFGAAPSATWLSALP